MKRILLLFVLVSVLLTGCCLRHDWDEATCENPKTCSKCDETEGEALGHFWVDATCEEPEYCSRCGAVQGEALGHVMTEWEEVSDSVMRKTCEVCGEEQEQEIDRCILGTQKIVGRWYLDAVKAKSDDSWSNIRGKVDWVEFYENGEMEYCIGKETGVGSYEYEKFRKNDTYDSYYFYCTIGDGWVTCRYDTDEDCVYWMSSSMTLQFVKK